MTGRSFATVAVTKMDLRLNFVFNILTVLLIQVVFSKCDLKTKTYNYFTKSYLDGFQRKERQAPIDPSRMYLPPKIDSVASSGFGGQIDVSNNFGGNNNGYGEVENVQETFAKSPTTDFSSYGLSTKTTDGDASEVQSTLGSLYDTSTYMSNGPVGSSLDQSNGHPNTSPGGNNFGQFSNKNSDYISAVNLPGTNNNYGSSLGTTSIPTNNGVAAPTATAEGYGQNELLNTAQNQGPTKYNYNRPTAASQFGQNPSTGGYQHSQQSTVENTAGGYGNVDFISSKDSLQDNNRIGGQNSQGNNGNVGSNRGQPFSIDNSGYANTATNSYGQKYTSGEYSQIENGNKPNTQFSIEKSIDISNNPSSIGSVGFPSSVLNFQKENNPKSKSTTQSNNDISGGNYGQNKFPDDLGFQAGGYNKVSYFGYGQYPSESSQGVSATTQSYGQNDFVKPNINSKDLPYSGGSFNQPLPINSGFEQGPNNEYNQKVSGINKNQVGGTSIVDSQSLNSIGTSNGVQSSGVTYQNLYSPSSLGVQSFNQGQGSLNYENGFDLNPQNQLQSSNNFEQSGSHSIGNKENYGQISSAYKGFNQDQQNNQLPNSYGPPPGPSQSFINGRNPAQSQSNDGYNQGRPSNGPNSLDQSRPSTPQVSNNYSNFEYRPSSLSGNDYEQSGSVPPLSGRYHQGSSSNELNGFGQNRQDISQGGRLNNYGPTGSQTLPTTRNSFTQNSPTNGAHPQEANQGSTFYGENGVKPNSVNRENIATTQLGYNQNGLASQSSGQESSSSPPGYGQGTRPCTSKNGGDIGQGKTSTLSPADPSYGIRNQKKHSTLVPKGQFQNSNLPSSGKGVQDVSSNANNNSNNFGEPGYNSFSNFAPGNQPNQPIDPGTNNCDTSKRGDGMNEAVFSPINTGY